MFVLSLHESTAGGVVSKVASIATDQLRLDIVWGFSKELNQLKESSTLIGSLIHDAANEPEDWEPRARAEWMKRLIGVAHDAEDVLDEVQYEVQRIIIEETSLDKKILSFFCNNSLVFSLDMARKICNINTSLEDLNNKAAGVGLSMTRRSNGGALVSQGMKDSETTSFSEINKLIFKEAEIVGRDQVVSDIIATFTPSNDQEKRLSVMAIVGLPGVGKTTLARLVIKKLKEGDVEKYFDAMIWVYLSNTFDVNLILRRMVESCQLPRANFSSREALIESLRTKLTKKRVFLVLDDVWNEVKENWDILKGCLVQINFAKGSTVVVTTRSANVASIMETLPRCDLGTLSDDECWSILKDRAFADPNAPIASELQEIGRGIAKQCYGLPLMAKVLGGLIRSKNCTREWLLAVQSKVGNLSSDEDSNIMSVLMLSFDNLTSPLKQCFAYCSMLHRGSSIEREKIIHLWMAQGFLDHVHDHQSNQDIGNRYFDTLLENSMFQDATKDADGVVTECKMHDLLYDLVIEVSKCESLTPEFNHDTDDRDVRHVARISTQILQGMPEISRLRSLFSNERVSSTIFPKFRALRVLSLCNTQELPNSIGNLKHLRYLDLCRTNIKTLPKSIGKLYNLQTLRLPHLELCPKEIQNLTNLRHFYLTESIRPMKFEAGILGRLTNLRTLRYFDVGKEMGPAIEELGGLKHLRGQLVIDELEHVRDREEAGKAFLVQKSHLSGLALKWSKRRPPNDTETNVLDGLKPHDNLQSLKIANFMGDRLPSWITSLQNLKQIRLVDCNNCERVATLGHLPYLRYLEISMKKLKRLGAEFDGTSASLFPVLKTLHITWCTELTDWMEEPMISAKGEVEVVFPSLEELKLIDCRKLRNAPTGFPCLKRLVISRMDSYVPMENMSPQLTKLTSLKISGVRGLTCIPEAMLKKNRSLKYLVISECDELTCIAPDVSGCCTSLRSMTISHCEKLRQLPAGLHTLPLLEYLSINSCPSLKSIQINQGIASLRELNIKRCKGLTSLEVGFANCTSLEELEVSDCHTLRLIPMAQGMPSLQQLIIGGCEGLSSLGRGLDYCTSLQQLEIRRCPSLMSIPIAQGMTSLQEMKIVFCGNLRSIPITQGMPSLRKLSIKECEGLSSIGSGLNYCTSLQELKIVFCHNLTSIPIRQGIISLQRLKVDFCPRLLSPPSGLQYCTSLQYLEITDCSSLVSISASYVCDHPESTSQPQAIFPSLVGNSSKPHQMLKCECGKLKYVPTGFHHLSSLKELTIGPFREEVDTFPEFQLPPQLELLQLYGWPKLNSLPQQIQHCTCLKSLRIDKFMGLQALPEWLGNLKSLESLSILHCEDLKYLPSRNAMRSLTKLKNLLISGCPLLKQRCTKCGPEWHKISHISKLNWY